MNKKRKNNPKHKPNTTDVTNNSFIEEIKKEWKSGWAKFIGWSLPITLMLLILQPILDSSLKIRDIRHTISSDKTILSPDNPRIEGGEFDIDETGKVEKINVEKQKPILKFEFKGKGKIDRAFYFYRLDQYEQSNNHITKYEFDVKSNIFCDMFKNFSITPSTLELPTNINIRVKDGEYSRSYLALRDADNKDEYKIYLIYLSKASEIGKYEVEIIDEKMIYQTAPDIYEKDNKLVRDIENIQKELQEIKSMLRN